VAIEVAVVNPALLDALLWPLVTLAVVTFAAAIVCYRRVPAEPAAARADVPLHNPFSLTSAIRFAALFVGITLAVEIVRRWVPGSGVYAVAALAGLTDVDAITLSMAEQAKTGAPEVAVRAISIAALANTLTKCGMVLALGHPRLRLRVALVTGLLVVAAVVVFAVGRG
jgi:uncharacterized membrane protein (DUF4010 family)